MKGIDCATPIQDTQALKDAGIEFACRYLVPEQYAWKRLTKAEVDRLTAAGIKILSVFESYAARALDGYNAGAEDGAAAYAEAKLIGQPEGSAIYFAVDTDTQDFDTIEQYFKGIASQLPGYEIGVYGSYAVIETMAKRGACRHFWQTYAWSHGQLSTHANVYQYLNGQYIGNLNVDLDESYGNEGFWGGISVLQIGSIGEEVIDLQEKLNTIGYSLVVDGQFGPATNAAVKSFQQGNGLTVDGIVGPATMQAIDDMIAKLQQPAPVLETVSKAEYDRVVNQYYAFKEEVMAIRDRLNNIINKYA